jgi:hypothetical protein
VSRRLQEEWLEVIVVLDNVHHASAATLQSLVEAAVNLRFVMLGQPRPGQAEAEARLQITAETLATIPVT